MKIHWWYWTVLGLMLIGSVLLIPSFTIIWIGIGALIVGVAMLVFSGCSLTAQLATWLVASIFCTVAWSRYLRPRVDRRKAGLSKAAVVGAVGLVITGADPYARGMVRFEVPLLGNAEWPFYTDEPLKAGARVRVVDVEGDALRVVMVKGAFMTKD